MPPSFAQAEQRSVLDLPQARHLPPPSWEDIDRTSFLRWSGARSSKAHAVGVGGLESVG
jgi:hypothetical protein